MSSRVNEDQSLVPDSGLTISSAPVGSVANQVSRPRTRLQDGIRKENKFTDGTIRYGYLVMADEPREPQELAAALEDKNWKMAMDDEIRALDRNKTWYHPARIRT
jgi:hypothetical protein